MPPSLADARNAPERPPPDILLLPKRLGGLRGFHGFTACHFHYCLSLGKVGPKMIDPFPEQIGATIFRPPCHFGPVCTFPLGFRRALGRLRPITKRSDGRLQRCYGLASGARRVRNSCLLRAPTTVGGTSARIMPWLSCLPSPTATQHQPDRRRRGDPACFSQFRVAHPSAVRVVVCRPVASSLHTDPSS